MTPQDKRDREVIQDIWRSVTIRPYNVVLAASEIEWQFFVALLRKNHAS